MTAGQEQATPRRPVPETREETAERLAPIAVQWAVRLRGEDVDTLAVELLDPLPRQDLYALIGLLGGAADPTEHPDLWWGWVRYAQELNRARAAGAQDDEEPAEPTQAEVDDLIARMAAARRPVRVIAAATGLTVSAVEGRKHRAARAGVAG